MLFRRLPILIATGLCLHCACAKAPAPRPNVVLVTLDTTRADHLGCYGYARDTSPRLDELAADSMVYERAVSTSSWTLPAHASMFTGKFTASHGARYDPAGPLKLLDAIEGHPSWEAYRARGLSAGETTLAGILSAAGYETGAVVAGPWMKTPFGLDAGFDAYDDDRINSVRGRLAEDVTDRAIDWIDGRSGPFLLFLNYYDPHTPYGAPGEWGAAFLPAGTDLAELDGREQSVEEMIALYDGEIRYMDFHIGRLLEHLRGRGLYENSWIVVTADHGELLGEHGLQGHGRFLFQPELQIPLIVKRPGTDPRRGRSEEPVQQLDVLPLICEGLGLPLPPGIQGQAPGSITHPIVAETYPLEALTPHGHWRALIEGTTKFAWNSNGRHLLFDLAEDPGEERNLVAEDPQRARRLNARLHEYLDGLPGPAPATEGELDRETREALKSLGYVD